MNVKRYIFRAGLSPRSPFQMKFDLDSTSISSITRLRKMRTYNVYAFDSRGNVVLANKFIKLCCSHASVVRMSFRATSAYWNPPRSPSSLLGSFTLKSFQKKTDDKYRPNNNQNTSSQQLQHVLIIRFRFLKILLSDRMTKLEQILKIPNKKAKTRPCS